MFASAFFFFFLLEVYFNRNFTCLFFFLSKTECLKWETLDTLKSANRLVLKKQECINTCVQMSSNFNSFLPVKNIIEEKEFECKVWKFSWVKKNVREKLWNYLGSNDLKAVSKSTNKFSFLDASTFLTTSVFLYLFYDYSVFYLFLMFFLSQIYLMSHLFFQPYLIPFFPKLWSILIFSNISHLYFQPWFFFFLARVPVLI